MSARAPLLVLLGPTASGKTGLALELAERLDAEIVSIDSALVYKGLDVGAAKPSREEQQRIRHWLIDIRDPAETYTAADFVRDARAAIADCDARGKKVVLAGGTMMYAKALLEGLSEMPASVPEIREDIERIARAQGWPALHLELARVDPISAERIHPNHSQRLSRALEVYRISGKPMSAWQRGAAAGLVHERPCCQLAIYPRERRVLHDSIAERFDDMLRLGVLDEVESLRQRADIHAELPAMRAVGYRQIWQYLEGEFERDELRERVLAATRQLAKRQLTWLRSWPGLHWLDTLDSAAVLRDRREIAEECLSIYAESTV